MAATIVCRGCGNQFGEVPNGTEVKGTQNFDVCPDCKVREKRVSPLRFKSRLKGVLFKGGPLLAYEKAMESFKLEIDALPVSPKLQPKVKDRLFRYLRVEGDS